MDRDGRLTDVTTDTILVIGYGNTLRSDDGVGPRVAEAVASCGRPGLTSIAVHQLTPELAESLAGAGLAIFVDARPACDSKAVDVISLGPSDSGGTMAHTCDPRSLLALARAVYGRHPRAWLVTVPVVDFSLGEGLSPTAKRGLDVAFRRIAALIEAEGYRCAGSDSRVGR